MPIVMPTPTMGEISLDLARLDKEQTLKELSLELVHGRIDDKLLEKLIERYEADPTSKQNRPIRQIFGFRRSKSTVIESKPLRGAKVDADERRSRSSLAEDDSSVSLSQEGRKQVKPLFYFKPGMAAPLQTAWK